jgi:hypothetical protein
LYVTSIDYLSQLITCNSFIIQTIIRNYSPPRRTYLFLLISELGVKRSGRLSIKTTPHHHAILLRFVSHPCLLRRLHLIIIIVSLMPPLLMHMSHPSETHYFPILSGSHRRILLHTHLDAPFVDPPTFDRSAVSLKIYSSGETTCQAEFSGFHIAIDWSATLGRWSSRYLNMLLSWAAGAASLVVFLGWMQEDATCE